MAEVLERGDIYFFYRPKVERQPGEVEGLSDVQRFYMVLHPEGKPLYRLIVVGQKQLPELGGPQDRSRRNWGFVEEVARRPEELKEALERRTYETKTRGERVQPGARPAGEGTYAIVAHGEGGKRHTHLAYALELPKEPGEVQDELHLPREASYVISVKNPEAPSPRGVGLRGKEKAELPRALIERFGGRRFADVDPPEFLDHEGAEVMLIGATDDASDELGVALEPEEESAHTADVCSDLRLECSRRRVEPLLEGKWA